MLTRQKTIELLREVVAEQGAEHVSECVYKEAGEPVCIVGHVAAKLGLLKKLSVNSSVLGYSDVFDGEPGVLNILDRAQATQDNGETWGEALKAAQWRFDFEEANRA